ncbi:MAG: SLC5 family protein [Armatimonadota bacterium]
MFSTIDAVFFVGYMIIVMIIGFLVGRREKATVVDYFRAGNTLPWYAIGFSIIAAGISSEQFVGEAGYAYKLGMPVVNWEWLIFPSLSILMWIFVPLYIRNRITTMPEYLERRFGPHCRTLYAILIVASYIFANFALVFYTGGFAIEKMWGFNRHVAVWILALTTGAYTIYGGLISVAWTDFFQCALLLGGGLYVFFSGMQRIGWDFARVLGTSDRAHLISHSCPEVPWTALIILALSTNVWYYATDQFINQRCLGARNEWHSKMGVLLAGAIQLVLPLATCFPGMIYAVINPNLKIADEAYPRMVAEVVPPGLRGLVVAAVLGAIMSTISGLVNSTATMVTLDIFQRWKGRQLPEHKLIRFGMWAGGIALFTGACFSILVSKWENMFRYCQDIWAPMAAPAVVVFLSGALWRKASERGAIACLWISILTIPLTFAKQLLADRSIHFLPAPLENSMVFAGLVFLVSSAVMFSLSYIKSKILGNLALVLSCVPLTLIATRSTPAIAIMVLAEVVLGILYLGAKALRKADNMWDRSMLALPEGETEIWYTSLWLWWLVVGACFVMIYWRFW